MKKKPLHWAAKLRAEIEDNRDLIAKLYTQRDELKERNLELAMERESMRRVVERKQEERETVEKARKFAKDYRDVCDRLDSLNEENRVLYRRIYKLEFKDE